MLEISDNYIQTRKKMEMTSHRPLFKHNLTQYKKTSLISLFMVKMEGTRIFIRQKSFTFQELWIRYAHDAHLSDVIPPRVMAGNGSLSKQACSQQITFITMGGGKGAVGQGLPLDFEI